MGRRAQKPELEFGSDSFLDVICNIVGILIILIVVVAVKVERQPKNGATVAAVSVDTGLSQAGPDDNTLITERQAALAELHASDLQIAAELGSLQSEHDASQLAAQQLLVSQELTKQQLESDESESDRLRQQQLDLESDCNAIAARVATLQKTLEARDQNALKLGQALSTAASSEHELDKQLRMAVVETQKLQEVLEHIQRAAVPKDRLQHRLSPVAKSAETDELHFRVENGRVSQIPLEELLERLKAQVLARRSTVMRFNQFEGTVGPVVGYNMTYVVEKEGPSTLEALQSGDGRMRITVSRWTIIPDAILSDESIEEALKPGSRYRQVIETAAPETVVTMWIYQDSFSGFAALREVAHGLRLRVAARPLPAGTPIVGSPNGSRSTAQ